MGDHTRKEFKRRDSKRVKQAEARVDEELRSNREDVTYEAGGFNDLGLNSGPSRKRKKKMNRHKNHSLVTFTAV